MASVAPNAATPATMAHPPGRENRFRMQLLRRSARPLRYERLQTLPYRLARGRAHAGCWREPRVERVVRSTAIGTALRRYRIAGPLVEVRCGESSAPPRCMELGSETNQAFERRRR